MVFYHFVTRHLHVLWVIKSSAVRKNNEQSERTIVYSVTSVGVCVFAGVVLVRALGIVASVSNNIKDIWRPVDMILLQATDNNRCGTLSLSYPHSEHVHHNRAYNNIAVITNQTSKKTPFLCWYACIYCYFSLITVNVKQFYYPHS